MPELVSLPLFHEIEQFYYREARLFSAARYREWLESMVDSDIHYWVPIFDERYRGDTKAPPKFPPAIYDDNHAELEGRIRQLETNLVWREDPPARLHHLVTNVEAYHNERPDEFRTYSNFLVCRNRREREQTMLVGAREDLLRRHEDGLRIARRKVTVPQRVLLDMNLFYLI